MNDTLYKVRDIFRAVADFETAFVDKYGMSINEGILLCSLKSRERICSGQIADILKLSPSNTSKLLSAAERHGYVERSLGCGDKRQMYFELTPAGHAQIDSIDCNNIVIPPILDNMLKNM